MRSRIDITSPVNWSHPLNRGLVLWMLALPQWSGGNTWFDLCRRNNGTLTNGPAWRPASRPGGFGELSFDGTDDKVTLGSPAALNNQDFTWAAWIYRISGTAKCIISINEAIFFQVGSGTELRFTALQLSPLAISGNNVAAGQWQHVVLTKAGASTAIYQDGRLAGSGTQTGTLTLNSWIIGGRTAGEFWNGQLDDVRIYNRALPAAEVAALYDLGRRGYPGVLRRVGRVAWSSPQVLPPTDAPITDDDVALCFLTDDVPALTFQTDDDLALVGVTDDDVDLE